jgi:hypothetical protein
MFASYIAHQRLRPFLVMQTVSSAMTREVFLPEEKSSSGASHGSKWRAALQFFSHQAPQHGSSPKAPTAATVTDVSDVSPTPRRKRAVRIVFRDVSSATPHEQTW